MVIRLSYFYKKIEEDKVVFLALYVDDILLIGNYVGAITTTKLWFAKQFDMNDLVEVNYILGIQIIHAKKNKSMALSQVSYIDKILTRFSYLFDIESNFLKSILLRILKRKKTSRGYHMPR